MEGSAEGLLFFLRGASQPSGDEIQYSGEEDRQEQPAERGDLPTGFHAASLGMPMIWAWASLRRSFQHQGQ